jgi:UPF0148 protein
MASRKEDEIMAEYLLKGGRMLEKSCTVCGCPLFEFKEKTFCVVCAENETAAKAGTAPALSAAQPQEAGQAASRDQGAAFSGGTGHGRESCSCDTESLAGELVFTIRSLCLRIQNEKDPGHVLTLMNSVRAGTEALGILCRL